MIYILTTKRNTRYHFPTI